MSPNRNTHILVVDDDHQIRKLLRRCLEEEGYSVAEAATHEDVLQHMRERPVHLITLDLNLPGDDGLTIARELRQTSNVPIIMITGKGDMIDKIVGLELGADDYIPKPFHVREVVARIRSVMRRTGTDVKEVPGPTTARGESYRFAHWTLDVGKRELLSADGVLCELTTGEFDMLYMFVRHPNRVLTRDQIMDLLKGTDWMPNDRSIDNQIVRLRRKIEGDPRNPRILKTVRGAGYSFTTEVR